MASPSTNPASEGILTLESGSIFTFTDGDVLVAQSRVMTEQGGDVVMWTSNGNLDAGKGAKTSVSAPPPKFACDIDWICAADIKGVVSGAGIATLQSLPNVPVGNADLVAPRGTVDAGAAGVRVSGNLNIAALQVLNVFNLDVKGVTIGVPTAPAAACQRADQRFQYRRRDPADDGAEPVRQRWTALDHHRRSAGIWRRQRRRYASKRRRASPPEKRQQPEPDPASPIQVIGAGDLSPAQRQKLTVTERQNFDASDSSETLRAEARGPGRVRRIVNGAKWQAGHAESPETRLMFSS